MANTIKIKNTGTASATPSQLEYGELAINYADGKLFYRNSANEIVIYGSSGSSLSGTTYSATIGDGSTTTFTLNHNLGTRDIFVAIRSATSPYDEVEALWEATSTSSATIKFDTPPANGSIRVSIYAAVTGDSIEIDLDNLTDVSISNPLNGEVLKYNGSYWVNDTDDAGTTINSIGDIGDVSFAATPSEGQILVYSGTDWINSNPTVGAAGSVYTEVIGDGATTSFTINHSLGTRDVFVTVRENTGDYENLQVAWEATSISAITVNFGTPPASNSVKVLVYSSVSGDSINLSLDNLDDVSINSATPGHIIAWNGSQWVNTNTLEDLTVQGNLIVSGTTTTINTSELLVEDSLITLNNGAIAPTSNAGVEVDRGPSDNKVSLRWNEETDKWQFTNDGMTYKDLGSGGVTVSDTIPSSPAEGDMWYESDTGALFAYYDSQWIEIGGTGTYNEIIGTIQAKGDLLVGDASQSLSRLPLGTDNKRLAANSSTSTGLEWVDDSINTVVEATGDILIGATPNLMGRLPLGSNGQVLTVDSNQTYGVGWVSQNTRNVLYNGAMQIHQRGTSATSVTSGGYRTADRWDYNMTTFGTWTQTVESDAPTGSGFRKSWKNLCTSSYSPSAANEMQFRQKLEGQDLQAFRKGTSSAEQFTLSFWVKSNVTGTYVCELEDQDNNRNVSKSYTIIASGTWEYKTLTFPADTVGQFDNDNNSSLAVIWWQGAGSNYTSGTLATSWATPVSANRAVDQVNLASSANNYWQITGVQLNVGSVAAPFEFKSYGQELVECQRYFELIPAGNLRGYNMYWNVGLSGGGQQFSWVYPVQKRISPTIYTSAGSDLHSFQYISYNTGEITRILQANSSTKESIVTMLYSSTNNGGTNLAVGYTSSYNNNPIWVSAEL